MSASLTFMMGEFEAQIPTDRLYAQNHMWAMPFSDNGDGTIRFGFAAYAVRLLQDVYFLDWEVEAPCELQSRQEIGAIESKKAESSLYAPIGGTLVRFNEQLMADPSGINVDKYGDGWLFEMKGEQGGLISPEEYIVLLESVWDKTQKTIKGQLNQ